MFEKFTERARKVMSLARQEAQRLNADFIGTEHILLGIISEGGGSAVKALVNLNVDLKFIVREIEKLVAPSTSPTVPLGQLPFSPRAKRVIELAGESASQLSTEVIGTEHLLIGLAKENEGIAAQVLINLGLKLDQIQDMVVKVAYPGKGAADFTTDMDITGTIIDNRGAHFTVLRRDGTSMTVQQDHVKIPDNEIAVGRRISITYKVNTVFLD